MGAFALVVLSGLLSACSVAEGADPEAIRAQLDALIPEVVSRGNAPSMQVAVVEGNRVIWSRAFGEDAATDRVHMNASVQKSIISTAVLQLVEKGPVDLDEDVNAYLPFEVRHPGFPDTPSVALMRQRFTRFGSRIESPTEERGGFPRRRFEMAEGEIR